MRSNCAPGTRNYFTGTCSTLQQTAAGPMQGHRTKGQLPALPPTSCEVLGKPPWLARPPVPHLLHLGTAQHGPRRSFLPQHSGVWEPHTLPQWAGFPGQVSLDPDHSMESLQRGRGQFSPLFPKARAFHQQNKGRNGCSWRLHCVWELHPHGHSFNLYQNPVR